MRLRSRVHAVDTELTKCFDRRDADLISVSIRWRVSEGRVPYLIQILLTSVVVAAGDWPATETGSPQGG